MSIQLEFNKFDDMCDEHTRWQHVIRVQRWSELWKNLEPRSDCRSIFSFKSQYVYNVLFIYLFYYSTDPFYKSFMCDKSVNTNPLSKTNGVQRAVGTMR